MATEKMTDAEIVSVLQDRGVDVNPGASTKDLLKLLKSSEPTDKKEEVVKGEMTDMEKIMAAISGVASSVDTLNKRVNRMEDGGKDDFKNDMKETDVQKASEQKAKLNPKLVEIVESTLGTDFGVLVEPNNDSPGFTFTLLVPERLSPIEKSFRPILDPESGIYKKDPQTGLDIEEVYWPGDRRSRAIGSTDSFDIIRDHCNKVRANIVTYYEKLKKPLPAFNLK